MRSNLGRPGYPYFCIPERLNEWSAPAAGLTLSRSESRLVQARARDAHSKIFAQVLSSKKEKKSALISSPTPSSIKMTEWRKRSPKILTTRPIIQQFIRNAPSASSLRSSMLLANNTEESFIDKNISAVPEFVK